MPDDPIPTPAPAPSRESQDTADNLREQAASCRRLAGDARTRAGRSSLNALAEHFDKQAKTIDPSSQRR